MTMQTGQLRFGHIGGSVHEVIQRLLPELPPFECAIIRSLDSERDVTKIEEFLKSRGIATSATAHGVGVDYAGLETASCDLGVFVGFDEVWFFQSKCGLVNSSALQELVATSDSSQFDDGVPEKVTRGFVDSECVLLLADGCGLNYVTYSIDLVAAMLRTLASNGS